MDLLRICFYKKNYMHPKIYILISGGPRPLKVWKNSKITFIGRSKYCVKKIYHVLKLRRYNCF